MLSCELIFSIKCYNCSKLKMQRKVLTMIRPMNMTKRMKMMVSYKLHLWCWMSSWCHTGPSCINRFRVQMQNWIHDLSELNSIYVGVLLRLIEFCSTQSLCYKSTFTGYCKTSKLIVLVNEVLKFNIKQTYCHISSKAHS